MTGTVQIKNFPIGTNVFTDTSIASTSPSTPIADQTQQIAFGHYLDQNTIKNPSGPATVDQTALTGLTGSLTSTGNTLKTTINGGAQSAPVNIINSSGISYDGSTLEVSFNGVSVSQEVDGALLVTANPVTATNTTLDLALSDIYPTIVSPTVITTDTTLTSYMAGPFIVNNTVPITITLPAVSLRQSPVVFIAASTTNSPVTITPVVTGTTVLTKSNQTVRFLTDGTNWYREGNSYSFKSSNITMATSVFFGGSASYSLISPASNFLCTISDNVVTVRMRVQITVTGTPTSKLITNFGFPDIIKSNFTSSQHVGGFSLDSATYQYGGGGPEASSYTNNFYTNFSPNIGAQTIQAITSITPVAGVYDPEIQISFDLLG